MQSAIFHITSESETEVFGRALGRLLMAGDVVGLTGDLGAGKTFTSRAICEGLDVPQDVYVNSPTFTLINEYIGGRLPVYHMDLYRLDNAGDLYELGLWEYYSGDGVCLVEWCDRFDELWPQEALIVNISLLEEEHRTIEVAGKGRSTQILNALLAGLPQLLK